MFVAYISTSFQDKMRMGSVDWVVLEATQTLALGILINILTLTFDSISNIYMGIRINCVGPDLDRN